MASDIVNAGAAGTWSLGDITVNRMGFGAMRLTGSAAFHEGVPSDRGRAISVLRQAVDSGVNHVDTAAFYFSSLRSANEIVNAALQPYRDDRDDIVVATKVGPRRDSSGEWATAMRPDEVRGDVEENLRQLGRDYLDLVYLRNMRWESIAEHFGALAELQKAGLVRHLGVSSVTVAQLAEATAIAPVVSVQNRYSLDEQGADDVLKACGEQGIAFVPFFAIAGAGRPHVGPTTAHSDALLEIAAAHDATPAQIRLAWTLAQGPHVLAIPGTGNPDHLVENIAAGAIRLSGEELARLASA